DRRIRGRRFRSVRGDDAAGEEDEKGQCAGEGENGIDDRDSSIRQRHHGQVTYRSDGSDQTGLRPSERPDRARGRLRRGSARVSKACAAGESGLDSTTGVPASEPSRRGGSSGIWASSGTSRSKVVDRFAATLAPPPEPKTSMRVPSGIS